MMTAEKSLEVKEGDLLFYDNNPEKLYCVVTRFRDSLSDLTEYVSIMEEEKVRFFPNYYIQSNVMTVDDMEKRMSLVDLNSFCQRIYNGEDPAEVLKDCNWEVAYYVRQKMNGDKMRRA